MRSIEQCLKESDRGEGQGVRNAVAVVSLGHGGACNGTLILQHVVKLLMEEIPNNHLTCMKPCKIMGYVPYQLVIAEFFTSGFTLH